MDGSIFSTEGALSRWLVQIAAWLTGIVGVVADYGFGWFGEGHLPLVLYAMAFGVGFGLDPAFYVEKIFGRGLK